MRNLKFTFAVSAKAPEDGHRVNNGKVTWAGDGNEDGVNNPSVPPIAVASPMPSASSAAALPTPPAAETQPGASIPVVNASPSPVATQPPAASASVAPSDGAGGSAQPSQGGESAPAETGGDGGNDGDENGGNDAVEDNNNGNSDNNTAIGGGNGDGNNRGYYADGTPVTTGGGTDREQAPAPTNSGNPIVADEDGGFLELDNNGTPLGTWSWDDDLGEWVFAPLPLGNAKTNPKTGEAPLGNIAALGALALGLGGLTVVTKTRRKREE